MIKLPELSEAQIEIMNVVWKHGEVTVTQVLKELNELRKLSRNTVQTMLSRLDKKGWLQHRQEGVTFYYSATVSREKTLRNLTSKLVDTAFAGSAEGLVMALLDGREITDDENLRIQAMIELSRKGSRE